MITSRDLDVVPREAARALLRSGPSRTEAPGRPTAVDRAADTLVLFRGDLSPALCRVTHELVAAGHALVVDDRPGPWVAWEVGHGLRLAGYAGALNSSTVRAVVAASIGVGCTTFRLDVDGLGLFLPGWMAIAAATHAFRHGGGLLQVQAGPRTRALARVWAAAVPDDHHVAFADS